MVTTVTMLFDVLESHYKVDLKFSHHKKMIIM